jgi:hypothetical protein
MPGLHDDHFKFELRAARFLFEISESFHIAFQKPGSSLASPNFVAAFRLVVILEAASPSRSNGALRQLTNLHDRANKSSHFVGMPADRPVGMKPATGVKSLIDVVGAQGFEPWTR